MQCERQEEEEEYSFARKVDKKKVAQKLEFMNIFSEEIRFHPWNNDGGSFEVDMDVITCPLSRAR